MDVQGQIRGKRESAIRVRQLAGALSGDYKIGALVYAAQLEAQAAALEGLASAMLQQLGNPNKPRLDSVGGPGGQPLGLAAFRI
jgi:hypothetical protein